jgi:hypothetical protein
MERRKDFSIIKINKYINGKRKINDSRYNWLNLTQLNGGIISPTNNNNPFRVLSQDKERSQTNENIKIKFENQLGKSEGNYVNLNLKKENTFKGKIINYIMKNDKRGKINTNINTNNSTVIKSKSAKKLMENVTIRRSHNNSSILTNNQLLSSNNNIHTNIIQNNSNIVNTNYNLTIEKFLAKEILKFLEEMKNLQVSICNKEPNVKELKKNFEKRKTNLYQEALKFSKSDTTNQILQDNRSYSSLISSNSAITAATPLNNSNNNIINYNQNVKELTDSISVLKTALEDMKSNSQFITSQLRTEITNLNNKVSKQMDSITQYEKIFKNNLNSIKGIYKLLKPFANGFNLNSVMDSLQSQNNSFSYYVNQQENKFEWYENEIKKIINGLEKNNYNYQNGNNDNNNIHIIDQKSSITDINDPNKLYYYIKNSCSEIIEMIRPNINEEENENELNNVFDTKDNFEDGVIMNEIENLKKHIKTLLAINKNLNIDKDKLEKEINVIRIQCETYKTALNNTVINKMKYNQKIEEDIFSESENYRKLNNDLLVIQNDLLQKLQMKDMENEKNQETIKNLLQLNKNIEKENYNNNESTNFVSVEKYRYLLNLFSNEQDQFKQLKSDYLHLIQDLSNYVENGTKISIDINKLNYNNTNKKSTNEINFEEEPDSNDLGRINENDLLTEKSTVSNKGINLNNRTNSKESKGSNYAIYNKYYNINNNNNNKISNFKQITSLKIELKHYKNEVEKLNKKLNDANDILSTLSSAIYKLFQEVQYTNKGKELFILIFKLLNYTEDKINKLFAEKEKMKK